MVALLVRVGLGNPVLCRRTCVGFAGRRFTGLSFNADCEAPGARGSLALASVLQRSGVVDAPQLWNVLRGDMSCVGPRVRTVAEAQGEHHFANARPGMTGAWRLSAIEQAERQGAWDAWTLSGDIAILMRTLRSARLSTS